MKVKQSFIAASMAVLTVAALGVTAAQHAQAAGPQVDWDCQLIRLQDPTGTIVYFDPRAEIAWSGKKLKYKMWSWASRDTRKSQAGRKYGTIKSNSGGWNRANLDLSTKFIYEQADSKYKKIVLKATDSSGRSHRTQCIWKGPVAAGW